MPSQTLSTLPPLARTAPPDHQLNWEDYTYPTKLPRRPSNQPGPVSAPSPQRIPVFEYQWGNELIGQLLGLPLRSNFGGKFAIIADPGVDNGTRAQIFADQLRSQGVPISYVAAAFPVPFRSQSLTYSLSSFSLSCSTDSESHSASRTEGTIHAHTLFFPCRCEDGCRGRFLISVGDDMTHPYGVPGQRIGVALYHPSSG